MKRQRQAAKSFTVTCQCPCHYTIPYSWGTRPYLNMARNELWIKMNRIHFILQIAFRIVLLIYRKHLSIKLDWGLSEEGVENASQNPYVQSTILAFLLHTADLLRYSELRALSKSVVSEIQKRNRGQFSCWPQRCQLVYHLGGRLLREPLSSYHWNKFPFVFLHLPQISEMQQCSCLFQ